MQRAQMILGALGRVWRGRVARSGAPARHASGMWRRGAAPALALLLAACASLYGLKSPEVSLSDIHIKGGNLLEQRFTLSLRVLNPNDKDLAVDGLTFELEIAGQRFARGATGQAVTLARLSDTVVDVDGTAQLISLLQKLPSLVDGDGKVPYRIKGEVVSRDYGRIPFDRKGETELPWSVPAAGGSRSF
ncbi:MAG: LEA type 2 family protein [Rhodocyclaceae bacterium]